MDGLKQNFPHLNSREQSISDMLTLQRFGSKVNSLPLNSEHSVVFKAAYSQNDCVCIRRQ